MARSLRKGRDEAVAIIVESIGDVFFSFMVDAVDKVARDAGLFLIVAGAGRTANEEAVVGGLLNGSIGGLMIVPSHLEYGEERFPIGLGGVPVVFVDRPPGEPRRRRRRDRQRGDGPPRSRAPDRPRPSENRVRRHRPRRDAGEPATRPVSPGVLGPQLACDPALVTCHLSERDDVAVVSFDDFPMADALDPAITAARQDPALMGRRAFELLLERIRVSW